MKRLWLAAGAVWLAATALAVFAGSAGISTAAASATSRGGWVGSPPPGWGVYDALGSLVECPQGLVNWGGGSALIDEKNEWLGTSAPYWSEKAGSYGWLSYASGLFGEGTLYSYAVCAVAPKNWSIQSQVRTSPPVGLSSVVAKCPIDPLTGKATKAIGGGAYSFDSDQEIVSSFPSSAHAWKVVMETTIPGSDSYYAYVVCGEPVKPSRVTGANMIVPPGATTAATVACPAGSFETGGGAAAAKATVVLMETTFPMDEPTHGWRVDYQNTGSTNATITPYVVCAQG